MIKTVFLSFLVAQLCYAKVELPAELERGDLEKALPLMQGIVTRYERARNLYIQKGPEAFVSSLSEKLSDDDKKGMRLMLAKLPELPKLGLQHETLLFEFENKEKIEFKVAEVILGRFNSGDFSYKYNFNLSPKENWDELKAKNKKDVSFLKLIHTIETLVLPSAFAGTPSTGRNIGIVTVGSLTQIHILPKLGYVRYGPQDPHNH